MTCPIEFFVPGIPAPGGSKKAFYNRSTGRAMITDDSKNNKGWRSSVAQKGAEAMGDRELLHGALSVWMVFRMPRPKGHFGTGRNAGSVRSSAPKHPTVKPDVLKLARSTEDALTGIVWRDDCLIVVEGITKMYTTSIAGAHITVEEL